MYNDNDIYCALFGASTVQTYNSINLHFNLNSTYVKSSQKENIAHTNHKYVLKTKNSKNTNRTREEIRQL